ncbi:MAG: hypothetical protein KDD22_00090, partial [Bdellovibrionales bacterium]|nr:hypothetical protein [Bdellovibrionales bacterium]
FKAVTELIQAYHAGEISAEVFYQLVNDMLQDSRTQMRMMAVTAAGSTPSVRSFSTLAELVKNEPFQSPIRADANTYLASYATLSNLNVLEAVLKSDSETVSTYTMILAVERLDRAARSYMGREVSGESSEPSPPKGEVQQLSQTQLQFQRFVKVLEDFIASNPDPAAASSAQKTLSSINSLLVVSN